MAVGAPERAAAMAWLAPLPPPKMAKVDPVTVSPASGALATRATRSVLIAPATRTDPAPRPAAPVTFSSLFDSGPGATRWQFHADRARHRGRRAWPLRRAGAPRSAPGCRARPRPGPDSEPTARRAQPDRHIRAVSARPWAAHRASYPRAGNGRRDSRPARDRGTRGTRR